MTDRPTGATGPTQPEVDDDAIAALVRSTVRDWTMPPQQLGRATWRERVREGSVGGRGRGRGPGGVGGRVARGWLRRVSTAAGAAAVLFVALALVAVYLTAPHRPSPSAGLGAQASPSSRSSGAASSPRSSKGAAPTPTPTPMPRLAAFGPPLPVTRLLLGSDAGFRSLDLRTGALSAPFTTDYADVVSTLPDGRILCICRVVQAVVDGGPAGRVTVVARTMSASGAVAREVRLGSYAGVHDATLSSQDQGDDAGESTTLSPDGSIAYIGWVVRATPVWHAGLDVVDVATGRLLQRVAVPDEPTSIQSIQSYAWAPEVALAPDGSSIVIRQGIVTGASLSAWNRWSAPLAGSRIGALTAFADGAGTAGDQCGDVVGEGYTAIDRYFVVCVSGQDLIARRVDLGGHPIGDSTLSGSMTSAQDYLVQTVVDQRAHALYAWDPGARRLARVDLATGTVATGSLPAGSASTDPLAGIGAAIGRWIAPSAAAKVLLQPGLALSPDGSRAYVLGLAGQGDQLFAEGSSGVWVFDTTSMAVVGHWAPTADFTSIAVSRDGSLVYAAGSTALAGGGGAASGSITVFGAATGDVRLIAGQLTDGYLWLEPALVP